MMRAFARATARNLLLTLLPMVSAVSCAPTTPGGSLALTSRTARPLRLDASFAHGAYAVEDVGASMILSTVSLKDLQSGNFENAQVVDIQLMWEPRAGRTPVSSDSTNLIIRYVVLVGDQTGIYGGGGFGWPKGTLGKTGFGLDITGSSLSLVDSTDEFRDLLSPAMLLGRVGGPLDAALTVKMRDTVSQIVTDRLGRPRWVHQAPTPGPTPRPSESDHS